LFAIFTLFFNQALAGPVMAIAYGSSLILLLEKPFWQHLLQPLAAYGKMALTNYLLQSLCCALLFYGYALGWVGSIALWQGQIVAILINALLILFSVWWLKYFTYGHIEWIWRKLSTSANLLNP
jgi:uncharacterized protein